MEENLAFTHCNNWRRKAQELSSLQKTCVTVFVTVCTSSLWHFVAKCIVSAYPARRLMQYLVPEIFSTVQDWRQGYTLDGWQLWHPQYQCRETTNHPAASRLTVNVFGLWEEAEVPAEFALWDWYSVCFDPQLGKNEKKSNNCLPAWHSLLRVQPMSIE